jgi:hypothetical protein
VKTDLRDRQGISAALAAASGAIALAPGGDSIVVDKLQDNSTSARGGGVTFIPTVFGSPHLRGIGVKSCSVSQSDLKVHNLDSLR